MSKTEKSWDGVNPQTGPHIYEMMGTGYHKGIDLGRRFRTHLEARLDPEGLPGELDEEPPIFAKSPAKDRGETGGFLASVGMSPFDALETAGEAIKQRYGVRVDFVDVETEDELLPRESFMRGRLPATRVVPVFPDSNSTETI